ncbi:MAG TPA: antibiotic biosynthesis monooxygenase [bacterium]|nr:antibiotic biosynthesis monooxygenase [bacterium]
MIARVWTAHATPTRARAYTDHVRAHVVPALRRQKGYVRAMLLERRASRLVEITVMTLWRSLDAVRGFAGSDVTRAVVADEAAALLTRFDHRVRHYEIVVSDDTGR